ncbi:hypothetical protein DS901_18475 [Loktanella sp. D2R18]|uniref:hypothetical protein n=1 Tax=Loktanella sp. D2R18 TaxID=2267230 RepID=UPI000DEB03E8|nr:hypothetical protein [Loktanella sp. D2R18]RBW41084.1 hypothetical protein DS901_18475 [Loktanella sp. D2R18]
MKQSRYGPSFISARSFQDALQILIGTGLVIRTTGAWYEPHGPSNRTARYQASEALLHGLLRNGASVAALRRHRAAEGIRLKDQNKKLVEYGNIQFADDARDRLQDINSMLTDHWVDLAVSDDQLSRLKSAINGDDKEGAAKSSDFAARTVHRVFNNSDWEQGGRFYGAWWMGIPSELRRYILIDGKRTVEVDYSGLHAAMLYAMERMDIPEDPYALSSSTGLRRSQRKLIKRTFNALLNFSGNGHLQPIEGFSEEATGMSWIEFRASIISSFPNLSKHFGSGIGLKLQYKDSLLAEAVMLKFAKMNYACLPVHDSFIVHQALQDDLTEIMQSEFEKMFGKRGYVSFDIGLGEVVASSTTKPIEWSPAELETAPGYEQRLRSFRRNGQSTK